MSVFLHHNRFVFASNSCNEWILLAHIYDTYTVQAIIHTKKKRKHIPPFSWFCMHSCRLAIVTFSRILWQQFAINFILSNINWSKVKKLRIKCYLVTNWIVIIWTYLKLLIKYLSVKKNSPQQRIKLKERQVFQVNYLVYRFNLFCQNITFVLPFNQWPINISASLIPQQWYMWLMFEPN